MPQKITAQTKPTVQAKPDSKKVVQKKQTKQEEYALMLSGLTVSGKPLFSSLSAATKFVRENSGTIYKNSLKELKEKCFYLASDLGLSAFNEMKKHSSRAITLPKLKELKETNRLLSKTMGTAQRKNMLRRKPEMYYELSPKDYREINKNLERAFGTNVGRSIAQSGKNIYTKEMKTGLKRELSYLFRKTHKAGSNELLFGELNEARIFSLGSFLNSHLDASSREILKKEYPVLFARGQQLQYLLIENYLDNKVGIEERKRIMLKMPEMKYNANFKQFVSIDEQLNRLPKDAKDKIIENNPQLYMDASTDNLRKIITQTEKTKGDAGLNAIADNPTILSLSPNEAKKEINKLEIDESPTIKVATAMVGEFTPLAKIDGILSRAFGEDNKGVLVNTVGLETRTPAQISARAKWIKDNFNVTDISKMVALYPDIMTMALPRGGAATKFKDEIAQSLGIERKIVQKTPKQIETLEGKITAKLREYFGEGVGLFLEKNPTVFERTYDQIKNRLSLLESKVGSKQNVALLLENDPELLFVDMRLKTSKEKLKSACAVTGIELNIVQKAPQSSAKKPLQVETEVQTAQIKPEPTQVRKLSTEELESARLSQKYEDAMVNEDNYVVDHSIRREEFVDVNKWKKMTADERKAFVNEHSVPPAQLGGHTERGTGERTR